MSEVTISGEFDTDESWRDRKDAHLSVCKAEICPECGMGPCGEYHHLGPRGNGACNELWCPSDQDDDDDE